MLNCKIWIVILFLKNSFYRFSHITKSTGTVSVSCTEISNFKTYYIVYEKISSLIRKKCMKIWFGYEKNFCEVNRVFYFIFSIVWLFKPCNVLNLTYSSMIKCDYCKRTSILQYKKFLPGSYEPSIIFSTCSSFNNGCSSCLTRPFWRWRTSIVANCRMHNKLTNFHSRCISLYW